MQYHRRSREVSAIYPALVVVIALCGLCGPATCALAVQILYGFDSDEIHRIGDWLDADGAQNAAVLNNVSLDATGAAAFGTKAASFPGNSFAALQLPGTTALGTSFTLAAMVREQSNKFSRLFSSYNGGAPAVNELVFDIDPSVQIGFGVRAIVNGTVVSRNVTFADSAYHHLAMTFHQGSVRLYLDGLQLGAAAAVSAAPVSLAHDLRFGEDYPPTSLTNEALHGLADDILVYDRALSAAEIHSLYQYGAAVTLNATPPPPPPPPPPIQLGSKIEMLVDDRLLGTAQNVALKLHPPVKQEIALPFNGPYESTTSTYVTALRDDAGQVRLYYRGYIGAEEVTLMAISGNGVNFDRPNLHLYEHNGSAANNIVWRGPQSHNLAPFRDTNPAATPDAKWKALGGTGEMYAMKSADGIHWELMQNGPLDITGAFDSQNTAFWDADAGVYRSFSRYWDGGVRAIQMSTSTDFVNWTPPEPLQYDVSTEHFYTNGIVQLPGAEHTYLGFPMRLMTGRTNLPSPGQSGVSDAVFMSSRDGIHWDRTFTEPWIPEGFDTTRSNMPAWGIIETADEEWSMYGTEMYRLPGNRLRRLAMRPYGFASVQAGAAGGSFESPPITFDGADLILNFQTAALGSIAVEIRDEDGNPIPGFTLSDMVPLSGDELARHVLWSSGRLLGELAGQAVRLYFEMKDADLFAIQFGAPTLAGDYDGNGGVEQLDYAVWKAQFGLVGKHAADGNGDEVVNAADYVLWRKNLGPAGAGAADIGSVPEPAAVLQFTSGLFVIAVTCFGQHRPYLRK